MEVLILASVVTAMTLAISGVSSPKTRSLIYVLPIPITIILVATDSQVNPTHLTGLLDTLIFMIVFWFLYKRLKIPAAWSIVISLICYILLALVFANLSDLSYIYGFIAFSLLWTIYILFFQINLTGKDYEKIKVSLSTRDYFIRGSVIFVIAAAIVGLQPYILGAAVTFPFNGVFAAYIMRNQLPVLVSEISRNFYAIAVFFLVIWLAQPQLGLTIALCLAWLIDLVVLYLISKLPRSYRKIRTING